MLRTSNLAVILLGTALLSAPAFSQEDRPKENSEVSVQAFGSFLKETTNNGVRQSATDSGGVLATYRYFFSKYHGVEANYGHSLNTNSYALTSGPLGVNAHSNEIAPVNSFKTLRDDSLHTQQPGPFRRPITRTASSVLLSSDDH